MGGWETPWDVQLSLPSRMHWKYPESGAMKNRAIMARDFPRICGMQ